jgi:hypothetical protein
MLILMLIAVITIIGNNRINAINVSMMVSGLFILNFENYDWARGDLSELSDLSDLSEGAT